MKSYGKVDELDQASLEARRKTRKRFTIVGLSTLVLTAVIVGAVVGTSQGRSKSKDGSEAQPLSTSVKAICKSTLYPDSCFSSLSPLTNSSTRIDPVKLFMLSMEVALNELYHVSEKVSSLKGVAADKMTSAAVADCQELLGLAMDNLNDSLSTNIDLAPPEDVLDDLKTWLSAAMTDQQTCIDGFIDSASTDLKEEVTDLLKNSTEFTSNSLAIITGISNAISSIKLRRLMSHDSSSSLYPAWLSSGDRKLLQSSDLRAKADIVVAQDGSGKYKTIRDALSKVPKKNKKRFVIYVKKGTYYENVLVDKDMWNVMMIGDGMAATVISGRLNVVDGTPTFQSATFAVKGKGFIAHDMGFRNTAGPQKHQAVALISTADQSVFYRCRMDAFQDTLYTHSNRQFYRDCNIYGTVDFIFGNAAVVLQNCNILPKKPMPGQQDTITAQGKIDPNQNTGIVIQNCTVWASEDLTNVRVYLGRPWKPYSTTVFMQSVLGGLIDPTGWMPWTGNSAPDTIFYAEFGNYGPGAKTDKRVKWKGSRMISRQQAEKFTVWPFIGGKKWISNTGVPFRSGF
ncbi:putative pectinesterase/pectinesterase inhibitor 24 [Acorus gramineus]|uniref:Pectinesterase n=1 Tax=Acorus gramineus TaxID=55184 RepID=A0AAV9AHW8_ACOGR|nr:putative pectinesterase/pectinesterase inhibitor 24 [Acorus gramineus]